MPLYWIILPIFLLLLIMVSPVVLNIQVKRRGKDDRFDLGVKLLWGLVNFNLDIPKISIDKNQVKAEAELEKSRRKPFVDKKIDFKIDSKAILDLMIQFIGESKKIMKDIRKLQWVSKKIVRLDKFEWQTDFGLDDAPFTGILTGFIWQGKSALLLFMSKMMKFRCGPKIKVKPHFNSSILETKLDCIIMFRVGYIIITSLFFLTMVVKYKIYRKLGGVKGVRASNSRINENCNGKHQGDGRC